MATYQSIMQRLKSKGCRVDGVLLELDGTIGFAETNVGGPWTTDQQNAVLGALGLVQPPPTPQQLQLHYTAVIQTWLDDVAQQNGYNNLVYACSYATSSVDLWKRQGAAFMSWRDSVWQSAINLLNQIQAGTAQPPANDQALIAELPQPNIPTV